MYFLIDGFNLVYRAALVNGGLTNSRGEPSGMVYGFTRTLTTLKKRFPEMKFVVTWDNRPQWKYDLFPQYKGERTHSIEGEDIQLRTLKGILYLLDIDQAESPGEEADDVIASLCYRYREQGLVYVYTNDKDMLALVEDGRVIVMRPKVGSTDEKFFDSEAVKGKFGVLPNKLIDFRSFDGDSSDALPGVPRVPRKKIASLLEKYGSVEGVFSNLSKENLTLFQKNSIIGSEVQVKLNKRLMQLNKNLSDLRISPGVNADRPFTESEAVQKLDRILKYFNLKSIKPDNTIKLFWKTPIIKYSDPISAVEIEDQPDLFND